MFRIIWGESHALLGGVRVGQRGQRRPDPERRVGRGRRDPRLPRSRREPQAEEAVLRQAEARRGWQDERVGSEIQVKRIWDEFLTWLYWWVRLNLIWVFNLLAHLPSHFCQIPINPGRIGQTVEPTKPSPRPDESPCKSINKCFLPLVDKWSNFTWLSGVLNFTTNLLGNT